MTDLVMLETDLVMGQETKLGGRGDLLTLVAVEGRLWHRIAFVDTLATWKRSPDWAEATAKKHFELCDLAEPLPFWGRMCLHNVY